jgi:Domain of unknown function (DUF4279)
MSQECSAALRVFSLMKSATELTAVLGLSPTVQHDKGDRYSPRNPDSRVFDRTTCIFETGLPMSATIEDHLLAVVRLVESLGQQLHELASDCEIDIICSVSSDSGQGGIVLNRDLLRRIADLRLDVTFDLYISELPNSGHL